MEKPAPSLAHERAAALGLQLLEADPSDLELWRRLFAFDDAVQTRTREANTTYWYEPMDEESWNKTFRNPETKTYFIEGVDDCQIKGVVCVKQLPRKDAWVRRYYSDVRTLEVMEIVNIAAHPPGNGYGALLMQKAEEIAKQTGCKDILLHASLLNEPARRLYERVGFTQTLLSAAYRYTVGASSDDAYKIFYSKFIGSENDIQREQQLERLSRSLVASLQLSPNFVAFRQKVSPAEWQSRVEACIETFLRRHCTALDDL